MLLLFYLSICANLEQLLSFLEGIPFEDPLASDEKLHDHKDNTTWGTRGSQTSG